MGIHPFIIHINLWGVLKIFNERDMSRGHGNINGTSALND